MLYERRNTLLEEYTDILSKYGLTLKDIEQDLRLKYGTISSKIKSVEQKIDDTDNKIDTLVNKQDRIVDEINPLIIRKNLIAKEMDMLIDKQNDLLDELSCFPGYDEIITEMNNAQDISKNRSNI